MRWTSPLCRGFRECMYEGVYTEQRGITRVTSQWGRSARLVQVRARCSRWDGVAHNEQGLSG